jgi:ligand-binding SRPBCC domain-containing protein
MPSLTFETIVPASLASVWAWHEDVPVALPALSPPASRVRVESADLPVRVGSRVVASARGPLGVPIRMVARIVEHTPPAETGGASARFVDEQESGPFATWRHEHLFASTADGRSTRMTDRVTYRVPLGPLGSIADRLIVRRQLHAMFAHRHATLHHVFGAS